MTNLQDTRSTMRKLSSPASGAGEQASDSLVLESHEGGVPRSYVEVASCGVTTPQPADAGRVFGPDRQQAGMTGPVERPQTGSRTLLSRSRASTSPVERLASRERDESTRNEACGVPPSGHELFSTREFVNVPEGAPAGKGSADDPVMIEGLGSARERLVSPRVKSETDVGRVGEADKFLEPALPPKIATNSYQLIAPSIRNVIAIRKAITPTAQQAITARVR